MFKALTPERGQHDSVEQIDRAIADEYGRPSQPYRIVDILAGMERRGTITPEMRQAGEQFRAQFRKAHISDLKASDYSRPYVTGGQGVEHQFESNSARFSVWKILDKLGGAGSPAGSIIWHVIGLEWSLKQWAMMYSSARSRRISEESASGILIGAICPLAELYGYSRHLTNQSEPK